jgi:hypothetical protein
VKGMEVGLIWVLKRKRGRGSMQELNPTAHTLLSGLPCLNSLEGGLLDSQWARVGG